MCFAMGFNTNQSQSQVEWNSFVEFRLIWAHECLKMFFYTIFYKFPSLMQHAKNGYENVFFFSDPNHNSVPVEPIHSRRAHSHTHTRFTRAEL